DCLSEKRRSARTSAVHVSLSSDSNVKQQEFLTNRPKDQIVAELHRPDELAGWPNFVLKTKKGQRTLRSATPPSMDGYIRTNVWPVNADLKKLQKFVA
ncbi:MAG: hypothetical protein EBT10_05150, partial [Methylocystaceae bacterium]|nr:hypothetical protein [Methylocystaceae bacterium]